MRLIDADKLIEFIDTFLSKTCKRDGTTISNRWYGALKRCVEEQPTIEIFKWIPCEERLPEESKEYFVTVQHTGWNCEPTKFTSTSKYNPKTRCFECENEKWRGDKVIAWMPKPEPYKEGE